MKKRNAPLETSKLYYDDCAPEMNDIQVKAPKPDPYVYEFKEASLKIRRRPGDEEGIPGID